MDYVNECEYILQDSYGLPQCDCEEIKFKDRYELEKYLQKNPDVVERIKNCYAIIIPS